MFFFLDFSWVFLLQSLQFFIKFPPADPGRLFYSPVDLEGLNNVCSCGHRKIKLLGDGLTAFLCHFHVGLPCVPCSVWDTSCYQTAEEITMFSVLGQHNCCPSLVFQKIIFLLTNKKKSWISFAYF